MIRYSSSLWRLLLDYLHSSLPQRFNLSAPLLLLDCLKRIRLTLKIIKSIWGPVPVHIQWVVFISITNGFFSITNLSTSHLVVCFEIYQWGLILIMKTHPPLASSVQFNSYISLRHTPPSKRRDFPYHL